MKRLSREIIELNSEMNLQRRRLFFRPSAKRSLQVRRIAMLMVGATITGFLAGWTKSHTSVKNDIVKPLAKASLTKGILKMYTAH